MPRLPVALRKESVDRNAILNSSHTGSLPSLSARRAWIEIILLESDDPFQGSLSARRAWIEIMTGCLNTATRNVALRKESVDRNGSLCCLIIKISVALRKESVDRNDVRYTASPRPSMSLSARRAWIEISTQCKL